MSLLRPQTRFDTVLFAVFIALICWALGCIVGTLLAFAHSAASTGEAPRAASIAKGIRYLGGLGLYLGAQYAVVRAFRAKGHDAAAVVWRGRFFAFHFLVLQICAVGALLGAIIFPLVGSLGGAPKSREELVLLGARTGGFFFFVWAPGLALVRLFVRGHREKNTSQQEKA